MGAAAPRGGSRIEDTTSGRVVLCGDFALFVTGLRIHQVIGPINRRITERDLFTGQRDSRLIGMLVIARDDNVVEFVIEIRLLLVLHCRAELNLDSLEYLANGAGLLKLHRRLVETADDLEIVNACFALRPLLSLAPEGMERWIEALIDGTVIQSLCA